MNKNKFIKTEDNNSANYGSATGYGAIDIRTTSIPDSYANRMMYGELLTNSEIIINSEETQNFIEEFYYITERDFNKLNDSILNPSPPNNSMKELFRQFTSK